ncbi:unnamed protein product, partial [Leptidea sinapis]
IKVSLCFSTLYSAASGQRDFPPGFKFGAATAAYQIEGGWDADGKAPNIWDDFIHKNPHVIHNRSNGDIACDSYNLWRQDVQIATDLGLHFYRISIAWSRLLPNSFSNQINEAAVKYYNNVIDGLLEKGVEPFITLYHWDLPQKLQDLGGWTNPLVADWFADYARVAFALFGDRVKTWITINEPLIMCEATYSMGLHAPGVSSPGFGDYLCSKNVIMAHAKAWRIYDEEFRSKYNGRVSLTNHLIWVEAQTKETEELAEISRQFIIGMFAHPIFTAEGGWPSAVERIVADNSKNEGYTRTRLPPFTEEEKELVRGTYDFFGLNFYTSRIVRTANDDEKIGSFPLSGCPEIGVVYEPLESWPKAVVDWFYIYPEGMRKVLGWLKENYGDLEYVMLENGFTNARSGVLLAIKDGVNVTHYTAPKFGLVEVDFNDPHRKRTPRASARYYANVIQKHSLDLH